MTDTAQFPMALAALAFGTDSESAKAVSIDGIYARVRLSAMCSDLRGVWYAGTQTKPRAPSADQTVTAHRSI